MAKELAMVQRTAKGKRARLYFIECEKVAHEVVQACTFQVPQTLADALRLAADIEDQRKALACKVQELAPKAEFTDKVAGARSCITVAGFAKLIGTGQKRLFSWLRKNSILNNNNVPYQRYLDAGYFRLIEKTIETHTRGTLLIPQTLITPHGQIWLVKRRNGEVA